MLKKITPYFVLVVFVLIFFHKVFLGLLPIPSDTIVGLYHPFRDVYSKNYPNGIPYKNFLVTDPVRQIYPWKVLSIESISRFSLPLWNPYEMAGVPHLANFQSGVFYPFNLLLLINPFYYSWTFFIILQLLLASVFMYLYVRNLKMEKVSAVFGAVVFTFSGFLISWLTWGNIVHTALWLPIILLSIDKFVSSTRIIWLILLTTFSIFAFFAGHLQTFFYIFVVALLYFIFRWFEYGRKIKTLLMFLSYCLGFVAVTAVQWLPTLNYINLSGRGFDQNWKGEGWFIPLEQLIQFVVPDFFGNPTTLNYWGAWNYGEFSGYIGILGVFFLLVGIFFTRVRERIFYLGVLLVSLILATKNPIAEIPYNLAVPFLSTAQPTRLIFLIVFSASVIAALGFNYFITSRDKKPVFLLIPIIVVITSLWIATSGVFDIGVISENISTAKRNLILPTVVMVLGIVFVVVYKLINNSFIKYLIIAILVIISFGDLYRFGDKFTPFTKSEYLFPESKVLSHIKKDTGIYRVATTDSRIFPPNFSTYYKIQSVDGYDPLYLLSYAKIIAASERGKPDINPPFGFSRIITPHNLDSKIIDFLNVKYVLSLADLDATKYDLLINEGETRLYQKKNFQPRVFFAENTVSAEDDNDSIVKIFESDLTKTAVINGQSSNYSTGSAEIKRYSNDYIEIETNNEGDGFLVLSDSYYPTWRAYIDGEEVEIIKTNISFRGLNVSAGQHKIEFINKLF